MLHVCNEYQNITKQMINVWTFIFIYYIFKPGSVLVVAFFEIKAT